MSIFGKNSSRKITEVSAAHHIVHGVKVTRITYVLNGRESSAACLDWLSHVQTCYWLQSDSRKPVSEIGEA